MEREQVWHNILISLARHIKNGDNKDREKLIAGIIEECLPDQKKDEKIHRRVEKQLNHLLKEEADGDVPLVEMLEDICDDCGEVSSTCREVCPTGAIYCDESGANHIHHELCVECGRCVNTCISGAIIARSEFAQVATMLRDAGERPVYAILAPSFVGQFGREVTPEIIKSALKAAGFSEVYEVAMAADITSVFEAEEFSQRMGRGEKFMITSCCCPAFIKFIEKLRPKAVHLVSPTVSPMIAMGKMLKIQERDCRVIFIGPCIAKKNEARRPDLGPAVDCVLTFKETKALLEAGGILLDGSLGRSPLADAAHDGRIYAHTGGVTTSITRAIKRNNPRLDVKPVIGNGLKQCGELLKKMEEGDLSANFMEGMGCPGGCVGGPGTIIHVEEGARFVNEFADRSPFYESAENPIAMEWMDNYYQPEALTSEKISLPRKDRGREYREKTGEYFSSEETL